jgi:hypothetical protein
MNTAHTVVPVIALGADGVAADLAGGPGLIAAVQPGCTRAVSTQIFATPALRSIASTTAIEITDHQQDFRQNVQIVRRGTARPGTAQG